MFKVIPLGELDIYQPEDIAFVVNYFWAILLEFARGIYKYIHNESVIEDLHTLNKNSICENTHLEPSLMNKLIDEDWMMRLILVSDS